MPSRNGVRLGITESAQVELLEIGVGLGETKGPFGRALLRVLLY